MSSTVRRRRSIRGSFVKVGKKRPRKFDENTLAELAKLIPDDFVRAQLERERIRSRYAEENLKNTVRKVVLSLMKHPMNNLYQRMMKQSIL